MKIYSQEELILMLRKSITAHGTQSSFAKKVGVSPSFLHDVLNGHRQPNGKIICELGLTEIRGFAKK